MTGERIAVPRRRWVGGVVAAAFALGGGAWGVHAWLGPRPPSTSIAYVLVVDSESEPTADLLFPTLGRSTFWLADDGAAEGAWDACRGTGSFAAFAPGATIQFETGDQPGGTQPAPSATVTDAVLRNATPGDLARLEDASREWSDYLDGLAEDEGVMPSRMPLPAAHETLTELEALAADGHGCLLVATAPYVDSEYLTVRLPDGMASGEQGIDAEHRDGATIIVVTKTPATS